MAPTRIANQKRRRSSLGVEGLQSSRLQAYGASSQANASAAAAVTFAPNVTPLSYAAQQSGEEPTMFDLSKLVNESSHSLPNRPSLFPPPPGEQIFQAEATTTTRKRYPPPNRRPSQGYIPRPPNAFILFRQFIIQRGRIPDTLERTQGGMGKIIGNLWRSLTLDERTAWEQRAREAKEAHKKQYPDYRYAPNHDKAKREQRKKEKEERLKRNPMMAQLAAKEDERCQGIAKLMINGLDGSELVEAVKELDQKEPNTPSPAPGSVFVNSVAQEQPSFLGQRRSSSVPPQNVFTSNFGWNMPAPPAFGFNTEHRLSHEERMLLGGRRASSARPYYQHTQQFNEFGFAGYTDDCAFGAFGQNFGMGVGPTGFETRSCSPLPDIPDADTSLFRSDFSFSTPEASDSAQYGYSPVDTTGLVDAAVSPLESGPPPPIDMSAITVPPLMDPAEYASSVGSNSPGFPYAAFQQQQQSSSGPSTAAPTPLSAVDNAAFENILHIASPVPRNPVQMWNCVEDQDQHHHHHHQGQHMHHQHHQGQQQGPLDVGSPMNMQSPHQHHQPIGSADMYNFGGYHQGMPFDDVVHPDAYAAY